MPAASISNGHTGMLRNALPEDIDAYLSIIGMSLNTHASRLLTQKTIGKHLHVVEFWMPGPCNLRCKHCYVAEVPVQKSEPIAKSDYAKMTTEMVRYGLHDVVIPGMEPLLRDETWIVAEAAIAAGARSVGLTTNGVRMKQVAQRLADVGLSVVNVSLDGPRDVHDYVRGVGVFDTMLQGVDAVRRKTDVTRLISNCTASRINLHLLPEVAHIAYNSGFNFASFHPFERAAEIDNSIHVSASEIVDGYESIRKIFENGKCGSVALEVEASSFDVILEMHRRGWFRDMDLVSDETGFLFYRLRCGEHILLVNLMGYPHHFIRTLRITDDGGFSSCRAMSQSFWGGVGGDIRTHSIAEMLASEASLLTLDYIWQEFMDACARMPQGCVESFLSTIETVYSKYEKKSSLALCKDVHNAA